MKSFYEKLQQVFYQFLKKCMHILLRDFDTEMGCEDVLKLRFGNKSLHTSKECKPDSNNYVTSKNVTVNSTDTSITHLGSLLIETRTTKWNTLIFERLHSDLKMGLSQTLTLIANLKWSVSEQKEGTEVWHGLWHDSKKKLGLWKWIIWTYKHTKIYELKTVLNENLRTC